LLAIIGICSHLTATSESLASLLDLTGDGKKPLLFLNSLVLVPPDLSSFDPSDYDFSDLS
jgi:hypothetical protein